MKPWCMRRVSGGSELKGCFPVRRTMEALRSIHESEVPSSRGSNMEASTSELALRIRALSSSASFSSSLEESKSMEKGSDLLRFGGGWKLK